MKNGMVNTANELDLEWIQARVAEFNDERDLCLQQFIVDRREATAKINAGVMPNIGKVRKGMHPGLHAPHDNYHYEWVEGSETIRKTFQRGQFLPINKSCDGLFDTKVGRLGFYRFSYKAPLQKLNHVKQVLEQVRLNLLKIKKPVILVDGCPVQGRLSVPFLTEGKTWVDDKGHLHAYNYLKDATETVAKYIENYLMAEIWAEREAEEKRREEERAAADPCPAGRVEITGVVLGIKQIVTPYGLKYKMLVKDDTGYKVYGSLPTSLDADKGHRVRFTATVEPSKDDNKFGFFKRPAKASILEEAA